VIDDSPVEFPVAGQPGRVYAPQDYDGKFLGPITLRTALTKSRNVPAVKVLAAVGVARARSFIRRFGFTDAQLPPYLPMALGVGIVTPLQLARAYAVFASGGFLIQPHLITEVRDASGQQVDGPWTGVAAPQAVLEPRNAFVIRDMLRDVVRGGTGAGAKVLGRPDIGGKTGSTNDFVDAWFAGFGPQRVAVSWIGFDTPRTLGKGEVGGKAALPMWIDYMRVALDGVPVEPQQPLPVGLVALDADAGTEAAGARRTEYIYKEPAQPLDHAPPSAAPASRPASAVN
jgi:penicillin-binding protein 1A